MTRIAVLSDTHHKRDFVERLLPLLDAIKPQALLFLGDGQGDMDPIAAQLPGMPLFAVRGNGDFSLDIPEVRIVELGGARIFMTHGHRHGVGGGLDRLADTARENRCAAALYGHTHRAAIDRVGGILLVNPGSISRPRDGRDAFALLMIQESGIQATHLHP